MTGDERESLLEHLRRTRTILLHSIAGISPEQWRFEPEPGAWSIAQCAEHVALTENAIFERVTGPRSAAGLSEKVSEEAQTQGKDELVLRAVPARRNKVASPEPTRPANCFAEPDIFVLHFEILRDRVIDYVAATQADLRAIQDPHFALQALDGYQWLLLTGSHAERHAKQIAEIKLHPAFPLH